jgi:small conductance mechanosensitive channel
MNKYLQQTYQVLTEYSTKYALQILGALAILMVGWWLVGMISSATSKLLRKSKVEDSLRTFLISLISIGLKVIVVIAAVTKVGIETTSFVAILGAASFAVGLALQGSLANFAGGALLLFFKPFKVGDLIEAEGCTGVVSEIQIFTTVLLAPAGKRIIVPNSQLSNGVITNYSLMGAVCVDLNFVIDHSMDIDKTKSVIHRAVSECPYISRVKGIDVHVGELAENGVRFIVRSWATVATYWDAYFFLQENIKKAFDREDIKIAPSPDDN